jgi:chromosome segregation ATPase
MSKNHINDVAMKFAKYQTRLVNLSGENMFKQHIYSNKLNKYTSVLAQNNVNIDKLRDIVMSGGANGIADITALEEAITKLTTKHGEKLDKVIASLDTKNNVLEYFAGEITRLTSLLTQLTTAKTTVDRQIIELTAKNTEISSDIDTVRRKAADKDARIAQIQSEFKTVVTTNDSLQTQINTIKQDKSTLESDLAGLRSAKDSLVEELDKKTKEQVELIRRINEVKRLAETSAKEYADKLTTVTEKTTLPTITNKLMESKLWPGNDSNMTHQEAMNKDVSTRTASKSSARGITSDSTGTGTGTGTDTGTGTGTSASSPSGTFTSSP